MFMTVSSHVILPYEPLSTLSFGGVQPLSSRRWQTTGVVLWCRNENVDSKIVPIIVRIMTMIVNETSNNIRKDSKNMDNENSDSSKARNNSLA